MTTLVIGTNRFEDCEHVFAMRGTPLFSASIRDDQPVVTLNLRGATSAGSIQVRDNTVVEGPLVVESDPEGPTTVRSGEFTVVHAQLEGEDTLRIAVDFRPIGLNIYTEGGALHVGGATLSGNVIRDCNIAINLG